MACTKKERSAAAKKGWNGRKSRYWVIGGKKPINTVPTGKVGVLINK
jgi:hypothetical protein